MKANNSQDKALNITWLETRRCGVHVSGGGGENLRGACTADEGAAFRAAIDCHGACCQSCVLSRG